MFVLYLLLWLQHVSSDVVFDTAKCGVCPSIPTTDVKFDNGAQHNGSIIKVTACVMSCPGPRTQLVYTGRDENNNIYEFRIASTLECMDGKGGTNTSAFVDENENWIKYVTDAYCYVPPPCDACSPLIISESCPLGLTCDASLVQSSTNAENCSQMTCSSGQVLVGRGSTISIQPVDKVTCDGDKLWKNNGRAKHGNTITCLTGNANKLCALPPNNSPPASMYREIHYDPAINGFTCSDPAATLITTSTGPITLTAGGCPMGVEHAICAVQMDCKFSETEQLQLPNKASKTASPSASSVLYCAKGRLMIDQSGALTQPNDSPKCNGSHWIGEEGKVFGNELKAGCYNYCSDLKRSDICGDRELCRSPILENNPDKLAAVSDWYKCPEGFELLANSEGKDEAVGKLSCKNEAWHTDNNRKLENCGVELRCVKKACAINGMPPMGGLFTPNWFLFFPTETANGTFSCAPNEYYYQFRQFYQGLHTSDDIMYSTETGIKSIEATPLTCVIDYEKGDYHFGTANGTVLATDKIVCAFDKCGPSLSFDDGAGVCNFGSHIPANTCGYGEGKNISRTLPKESSISDLCPKIAQMSVRSRCRATIRLNNNPLSNFDIETHSSDIPNKEAGTFCEDVPSRYAECVCETEEVPRSISQEKSTIFKVSHDSRYGDGVATDLKSFPSPLKANMPLFDRQSYSLTGFSTNGSIVVKYTEAGSLLISVQLDFVKFGEDNGMITISRRGESDIERPIIETFGAFSLRLINTGVGYYIRYNGRLIYFATMLNTILSIDSLEISKTDVEIYAQRWFIPKKCRQHHVFNERTGECEWAFDPKWCASLYTPMGELAHTSGIVEEAAKNETYGIMVRNGCKCQLESQKGKPIRALGSVYAYGWHNPSYVLPNMKIGSACSQEESLAKAVCEAKPAAHYTGKLPLGVPYDIQFEPLKFGSSIELSGSWSLCNNEKCNFIINVDSELKYYDEYDNPSHNLHMHYNAHSGLISFEAKWKDAWKGDHHFVPIPFRRGDPLTLRITFQKDGFEVRCNGKFLHAYPSYYPDGNMTSVHVTRNVYIAEWRRQEELSVPHNSAYPLKFGEYIYINGILTGSAMQITIGNANRRLFDLMFSETNAHYEFYHNIAQVMGKRQSKSGILKIGVEFDIVIAHKPHAFEVFVNGELIFVMNHYITAHFPEDDYGYMKIDGNARLFAVDRNKY